MTRTLRKRIAAVAVAVPLMLGLAGLAAGTAVAEPRYGAPCTDQSGAPGYYIWENPDKSAPVNHLICNITGDAPQVNRKPRSRSRAGQPCTNQDGARGRYIWSPSSNMWVCMITGNAPRRR